VLSISLDLLLFLSFRFLLVNLLDSTIFHSPTSLSFEIHSPTKVSSRSISISLERPRERLFFGLRRRLRFVKVFSAARVQTLDRWSMFESANFPTARRRLIDREMMVQRKAFKRSRAKSLVLVHFNYDFEAQKMLRI
jgi:hypothetical protein